MTTSVSPTSAAATAKSRYLAALQNSGDSPGNPRITNQTQTPIRSPSHKTTAAAFAISPFLPPPPPPPPPPKSMDEKTRATRGSSRVLARWQAVVAGEEPSQPNYAPTSTITKSNLLPPPPPPPMKDKKIRISSSRNGKTAEHTHTPSWVKKHSSSIEEDEMKTNHLVSHHEKPDKGSHLLLSTSSPKNSSHPSTQPQWDASQSLRNVTLRKETSAPVATRNQWDTHDIPSGVVTKANKDLFILINNNDKNSNKNHDNTSPQLKQMKSQWTPGIEIPRGTVSGRKAAFNREIDTVTSMDNSVSMPIQSAQVIEETHESDPWILPTTPSGKPCWGDDVAQSTSQDIWDDGNDWFGIDGEAGADLEDTEKDSIFSPTKDALESEDVYLSGSSKYGDFTPMTTESNPPTSISTVLTITNTNMIATLSPQMLAISKSIGSPRSAGPVDMDEVSSDDGEEKDEQEYLAIEQLVVTGASSIATHSTSPAPMPPSPAASSDFFQQLTTVQPLVIKVPASMPPSPSASSDFFQELTTVQPLVIKVPASMPSASSDFFQELSSTDIVLESTTLVHKSPKSTASDECVPSKNDIDETPLSLSIEKKDPKKRRGIFKFFGIKKEGLKNKHSSTENFKNVPSKTKSVRSARAWNGKTLQESSSRNTSDDGQKSSSEIERSTAVKNLPKSSPRISTTEKTSRIAIDDDPAVDGQENLKGNMLTPSHLTCKNSGDITSTVSEMTNATIFAKVSPGILEAVEEKDSDESASGENSACVMSIPVDIMEQSPSASIQRAIDPFDLNSPVFASGDPFGIASVGTSLQDNSDPFGDPFFENITLTSPSTPKRGDRTEQLLTTQFLESPPIPRKSHHKKELFTPQFLESPRGSRKSHRTETLLTSQLLDSPPVLPTFRPGDLSTSFVQTQRMEDLTQIERSPFSENRIVSPKIEQGAETTNAFSSPMASRPSGAMVTSLQEPPSLSRRTYSNEMTAPTTPLFTKTRFLHKPTPEPAEPLPITRRSLSEREEASIVTHNITPMVIPTHRKEQPQDSKKFDGPVEGNETMPDPEIYLLSSDEEEEMDAPLILPRERIGALSPLSNRNLPEVDQIVDFSSFEENVPESLENVRIEPKTQNWTSPDIQSVLDSITRAELNTIQRRSYPDVTNTTNCIETNSLPSQDQSLDSTHSVYPSQSTAINNRLQKKRMEKKLRKSGIQEEKPEDVAEIEEIVQPRVSTSAYLGRFTTKPKPRSTSSPKSKSFASLSSFTASDLEKKEVTSKVSLDTEDEMSWSTDKATAPGKESDSSSVVSASSSRTREAMTRRKITNKSMTTVVKKGKSTENSKLPRSILRKPSRAVPESDKPALGFDQNKSSDPMHRAGLRLLAVAVIPIQGAIRRFLSKREALNRMWAIVTIQTFTRRWAAVTNLIDKREAAIRIQKSFRGWFTRDFVEDQHYCAMQIQRIARGYLATLAVYADIYKVTLVQSYVRMKISVDEATYKMAFIIQLQSIIRGYLVRRLRRRLDRSAITIQKVWRGHAAQLNYQFDILDVILLQSLFRQNKARHFVERERQSRNIEAATTIQAQWRSYDCTMNYLHYLADVLIVQSAIRRWIAAVRTKKFRSELHFSSVAKIQKVSRVFLVRNRNEKNNAALSIQTAWRGFVCYADYMFVIADVVIVQTCMRAWLARRDMAAASHARDCEYIKPLQTLWRGYSVRQKFVKYKQKVTICQSVLRRFVAWSKYMKALTERYAAETIQRAWWDYLLRRDEHYAATTIQRYWRGHGCKIRYSAEIRGFRSARKIQTSWRKFWLFSNFIIMLDSAIRLQAFGRGALSRRLLLQKHTSATMIQSHIRSFAARRVASVMSMIDALESCSRAISGTEITSAITLQSNVRGFQARYAILLFLQTRKIQSAWRGALARHAFSLYLSSRKIQSAWRGSKPRKLYTRYCAATCIQSCWRCASTHDKYIKYISPSSSGIRIKRWLIFRRDNSKWIHFITLHRAAIRIQTWLRCRGVSSKYKKYKKLNNASLVIQKIWRGFLCYTDYIFTVADIITVQRICRGFVGRQRAYHAWLKIKEDEYAGLIQRVYRGYKARTGEEFCQAKATYNERRFQFATLIQKYWRGYEKKRQYWYTLGCCLQIQRMMRGSKARHSYVNERDSIIKLQCIVRRYMAKQKYMQMRFIMMLLVSAENEKGNRAAASKLQFWYKSIFIARKERGAALIIQSFFLMVKAMVETEIRAEKRRRKLRKLLKNRTPAFDEMLLEDAWVDSCSPRQAPTPDIIRRAEVAAANSLNGSHGTFQSRTKRPSNASKPFSTEADACFTTEKNHRRTGSSGLEIRSVEGSRSHPQQGLERQSSLISRSGRKHHSISVEKRASGQHPQKQSLPPIYADHSMTDHVSVSSQFMHVSVSSQFMHEPPADTIRVARHVDDDDCTQVSALTSVSLFRPPAARSKTFSKKELDDDFSLEEAWIDTEIKSVKERMTQSTEKRPSNASHRVSFGRMSSGGRRGSDNNLTRLPTVLASPVSSSVHVYTK